MSFDKEEWFDVCREVNPNLTREEYEVMWEGFLEHKLQHQENLSIN